MVQLALYITSTRLILLFAVLVNAHYSIIISIGIDEYVLVSSFFMCFLLFWVGHFPQRITILFGRLWLLKVRAVSHLARLPVTRVMTQAARCACLVVVATRSLLRWDGTDETSTCYRVIDDVGKRVRERGARTAHVDVQRPMSLLHRVAALWRPRLFGTRT